MNPCADPRSTCTAFAPTLPRSATRSAQRPGAIVTLQPHDPADATIAHQFLLVFDRSLAVNTAAAGGNASLMAIG